MRMWGCKLFLLNRLCSAMPSVLIVSGPGNEQGPESRPLLTASQNANLQAELLGDPA